MKLRGHTPGDVKRVDEAIAHMRQARELLKTVGARKTLQRIRLALTSAGGARRHALRVQYSVPCSQCGGTGQFCGYHGAGAGCDCGATDCGDCTHGNIVAEVMPCKP